jgi:PAS domain S-box-containing protein
MIAVGVIARNITERKRAEEALRKSEENYRLILDNIPLFIAAIDQTGKFFLWNKYAEKMLGYTSQEAIGKIIPLDIHETKKDADEVIRVASERGIYDKEIRFRHKDKTFIPVRLVVVPNKDSTGKIVGFYGFGEDITERKRAEEALKKSAQLLRDTGEMAKVGGWELDLSTKEVLWTEEVHRIHGVEPGYKPKLEEAMNFYAPESRPALEVVLKKVAETGEPYDLESLFIPSGSKDKIWVRSLGRAVYSGGKIVKLTGIFQNIDKYKRAEEALRVSLEKYRVLFESFPLGITISDKSGKIIEGNRQSEQLLGITREAHAQRRIDSKEWQIIRKDGTPMPADEYASTRALRENRLIENVEMGIVKDKGEITWISVTAAPILLEGYGVAIVYGDITERKRAEEEIKNLAKFPAENPFPILRLNQDGIVLYANEASQVLLRDWGCMVGGYAPKFWCDLATEALASQSRRTIDVGCGQQVYSFVVAPISDAGYVNLYGEDITERKRVEEALRRKSGEQALLLDNIQTQVWYLTDKETYGAVNKARAEFFGKKNEEMENKKLYDVLGKNEAEICMSGYAEVFEKRKQIHTEEWITNAKDEKRLLSIIKSPKLDENGDVGYVVCSAEDITERKRAEKERDQLFEQVRASRERLRNLSRRLVEVQEVERHDLVRKLHDEVGQSLTALSINLNIVHSQLPPETAIKTATRIDDSLKLVEETVERIRDVMVELRPPVLDDYGVSATLHWYGKQFSERTGIPAVLKVEELKPRLPLPEETALFRIAQEALTNVAKYAQAKNVTVGLKEFDKVIYLTIADDGVGFDPTAHHQPGARPEWGLINMRERAQTVGGTLNIETAPGKGTRIMVEVPRNR